MITVIKPIIFAFLKTNAVKELVVKLLEAYAKNTDNTVDDKLVELVKKNLLPNYWQNLEHLRVLKKQLQQATLT